MKIARILALTSTGLVLTACSTESVTAPLAGGGIAPRAPRFAVSPSYTSDAGITPTTVLGNINTVANACGSEGAGFKIDSDQGGTFMGVTVTTSGTNGNQLVAWQADAGVRVSAVYVKGAAGYNRYGYAFPAPSATAFTRAVSGGEEYFADAHLVSPVNNGGNIPQISHTIFCVGSGGTGAGDPEARLSVRKFYDANANGVNDAGDQYITGWQVNVATDGFSAMVLTPYSGTVLPGAYTVTESTPLETNWFGTTANPVSFTLALGGSRDVEFGNVCVGAGGGLTLGFWSNKNGQALVSSDDLAKLVALNLRNASGGAFDPGTYAAFRSWILSATATNMANMLSAQLAAMALNVHNGKVTGTQLIYAPGTASANTLGFATVNAVMAEADAALGANGLTVAAGEARTRQEALKNALDNANNNRNFVQAQPCAFTFASPAP